MLIILIALSVVFILFNNQINIIIIRKKAKVIGKRKGVYTFEGVKQRTTLKFHPWLGFV